MTKIRKMEEPNEVEIKCEDVCLAKFTKLPYILSNSIVKQAFEVIHIDIWGAFRVAQGTIIVDGFSRVTWVKEFKEKSQVFSAIEEFVHMSKAQYGKEVKVIRSTMLWSLIMRFVRRCCGKWELFTTTKWKS